jgi:hypothetical protein
MTKPMDEKDWKPSGPQLDRTGRMVGSEPKHTVIDRPPVEPAAAEGEAGAHGSGWTVPAAPPSPVEPPFQEVSAPEPRSSSRAGAIFAFVCLIVLGAAAFWWGPSLFAKTVGVRLPSSPAPLLSVSSDPAGAAVRINGASVGQTPIFMDNLYPAGQSAKVEIVLKGYRPWTGTFHGGEPARVEADLERR